jgi:hypothetical protein
VREKCGLKRITRIWSLGFVVWSLEFRVWGLVFGIWFLEFGFWNLVFGIWFLEFGFYNCYLFKTITDYRYLIWYRSFGKDLRLEKKETRIKRQE